MALRAKKFQSAKTQAIGALKTRIAETGDFIFTEYRGVTVEQISGLRKQLRAKNAEFHIIKNNFARIAFGEAGFKGQEDFFTGPTAVAFAKQDSNEVAKIIQDMSKDMPLKMKGAFVDKALMSAAELGAYAKLPGKKQLLSMFMSAIRSPVQKLVYTLVALQEKLGEGASAAPEAAAPEAPAQA